MANEITRGRLPERQYNNDTRTRDRAQPQPKDLMRRQAEEYDRRRAQSAPPAFNLEKIISEQDTQQVSSQELAEEYDNPRAQSVPPSFKLEKPMPEQDTQQVPSQELGTEKTDHSFEPREEAPPLPDDQHPQAMLSQIIEQNSQHHIDGHENALPLQKVEQAGARQREVPIDSTVEPSRGFLSTEVKPERAQRQRSSRDGETQLPTEERIREILQHATKAMIRLTHEQQDLIERNEKYWQKKARMGKAV
jgi:hypothetical protein